MLLYILKRLMLAVSVIAVVLTATFFVFFAGPADPAQALCPETRCSDAKLAMIRAAMNLDRPVTEQYVDYVKGIFVGRDIEMRGTRHCDAPCLGVSFKTEQEVKEVVLSKFPSTATLAVMILVLELLIGIPLGVFAARRRGSGLDRFTVGASQVFSSIPYYILALLFAIYLTVLYPVFPRAAPIDSGIGPWLAGLLAPATILGLVGSAGYLRYSRSSMVDSLTMDFVRTARSKGISESRVVFKHALRAALGPVVTIAGLDLAALMSGTLVTEQIFGVDGMGKLAISALGNDDLPIIMGTVLVATTLVIVMNLVVDILYSVIDPRVRLS